MGGRVGPGRPDFLGRCTAVPAAVPLAVLRGALFAPAGAVDDAINALFQVAAVDVLADRAPLGHPGHQQGHAGRFTGGQLGLRSCATTRLRSGPDCPAPLTARTESGGSGSCQAGRSSCVWHRTGPNRKPIPWTVHRPWVRGPGGTSSTIRPVRPDARGLSAQRDDADALTGLERHDRPRRAALPSVPPTERTTVTTPHAVATTTRATTARDTAIDVIAAISSGPK